MRIDFSSIHFAFPDRDKVLRDITLEIAEGTSLGLIGPSGCGKTTLGQLVPRFSDPLCGHIFIDGRPLRECVPVQLRQRMGLISQTPFIMTGTVRENLTFGNRQSDSRLIDMINLVRPTFWDTLPQGLDTQVGEGGVRLSGGERQCLAIIRELLRPIDFILIDEATASLDPESQDIAQAAIDTVLARGVTTIMIAHRLSTTRNCDRLCVMRRLADCAPEEPQIEAVARSHDELAMVSPTFRQYASLEGLVTGVC
jgi:ABC-type multidrug transport system fused ATPase/permease subunit